jgi:threonine synthase
MRFYSSNKESPKVSFKQACLNGQAPDKGLYIPEEIPELSSTFIYKLKSKDYQEISYEVLWNFVKDEIPNNKLRQILKAAFNFPVPLQEIWKNKFICYLDKGPTCSFKDFGARLLAQFLEYFLLKEKRELIILVATSGDTGGAVASAFFNMEKIKVVILYPKFEVSDLQRKQMTTLGGNISAVGLEGKFDECQAMIKRALNDPYLENIPLSSANSINIGRLIAQITYYFWSYTRVGNGKNDKIIYSVPSGNFGNLLGGLLAKKMGLPIKKLIAAVNENDEFSEYLRTGIYKKIEPSINCISSAMNVGHPSNLARIIDLYGGFMDEKGIIQEKPDFKAIKKDIISYSIKDKETERTIKEFYSDNGLILDPHGAVAMAAENRYRDQFIKDINYKSVIFETANPAKFPLTIENLLEIKPKRPKVIERLNNKQEVKIPIEIKSYYDFRNYLKQIVS